MEEMTHDNQIIQSDTKDEQHAPLVPTVKKGKLKEKKSEDKTHPNYNVLSIARKPMQTLTVSKQNMTNIQVA